MTHEEKVGRWLLPFRTGRDDQAELGVEVGAFESPVPGIRPVYVDRFAEFGGKRVLADYWGDLCSLPFRSNSLDYVVASHVLEHVANPAKALWECARVVRHGGVLYFVIPDRRFTFDHTRPLTPAEHMIADFDAGVTDCDGTHLGDYLDGLDWRRWNPNTTDAENAKTREELRRIYLADLAAGREINIHFHTFETRNVTELVTLMNRHPARTGRLEIVDRAEQFPAGREDGLLFVIRVHKGIADQARGFLLRRCSSSRPEATLRPDAKRFPPKEVGHPASAPPTTTETMSSSAHAAPVGEVRGCIDSPAESEFCDPLGFRVEGWVHVATGSAPEVQVWVDGTCVGTTSRFFVRPDVNAALQLAANTRTGFRVLAHHPGFSPGEATLELRVPKPDGTAWSVTSRNVRIAKHDHRRESFGILLEPTTVGIMKREHMYTTGPSRAEGSAEVLSLLAQYLPPPPCRIADVGCGLGWYGRGLRELGYDWLGLEVKGEDCAALAAAGLPYQQVDGTTLPFADGHFDAAISVEVLEHVDDPRAFLREIRRVAPGMLLISVPNAELVPYLHPYLATPRHMLDSDHRSFFTRWSLGSLLREFYSHAEVLPHTRHPLQSVDGTPLFYNLFAVAWS